MFSVNTNLSNKLFLIAGPCVVENEDVVFEIANRLVEITSKLDIPFIFKASFKKANRTKGNSFMGIGDEKSLEIIKKVGAKFNVLTTTDIHETHDAALAAQFVDVLQIPAFLCRQTDLLQAAADTGKIVNIKKGQFMDGHSMGFAVEKVKSKNPDVDVLLTERGNSFGYGELVVDFRNIVAMQEFSPVVMDCTHSLQRPNQAAGVTGGTPKLIETMAKAAVAVGVNGLFIETHPQPTKALSDGANMLPLSQIEALLEKCLQIKAVL